MPSTSAATTFDRNAYAGALIVPVTTGQRRIGSKATGALVEDEGLPNGPLAQLRKQLAIEAKQAGVDGDDKWINMCVGQLLNLYEGQQAQYQKSRTDEVGFVYEGNLPSGRALIMASSVTLSRLGLLH